MKWWMKFISVPNTSFSDAQSMLQIKNVHFGSEATVTFIFHFYRKVCSLQTLS
jgi:hypothetical protein